MINWRGDISQPVVSVCCATYNHENYIGESLDGFLTQETNFIFEVIVRDDASTDKTADIIKEYERKYPNIIKPSYEQENGYQQDIKPAPIMFKKAKGEYIAICDGDDYWIEPCKLQKQVDYLNENQEYGMVYTKAKVYIQKEKKFSYKLLGTKIPLTLRSAFRIVLTPHPPGDLLFINNIPTSTVICRRSLILRYLEDMSAHVDKWMMGDRPLWIWFQCNSKICSLDTLTSVYRILINSMSHFENRNKSVEFAESSFDCCNFFAEKLLAGRDYDNFLETKYLALYYISIRLNTNHHSTYYHKLNKLKNKRLRTTLYLHLFETFRFREILTSFFAQFL